MRYRWHFVLCYTYAPFINKVPEFLNLKSLDKMLTAINNYYNITHQLQAVLYSIKSPWNSMALPELSITIHTKQGKHYAAV